MAYCIKRFILAALLSASLLGGKDLAADQSGRPVVLVSVPAQAYWVDRIWGEAGTALPVIGPGQDPHTFDPSVAQVRAFSRANIYFRTGLGFEHRFIDTLSRLRPDLQVVDLRAGVRLRRMEAHSHAPGQKHVHAGPYDPHIWFGPREALIQIETIHAALSARYPERAAQFEAGRRELAAEIRNLDAEIESMLAPVRGSAIVVYHPAFGYFFDRYGLVQIPVEISGREPSPRQLQAVIDKALDRGVYAVWAQREYADRAAKAVAMAIGARVNAVEEIAADWPDHLRRLARAALR